ncbi:MAG: NAD(+) diphosphatase, partial [Deltaproteobacteria bacterium]|nr:NAD(+) diphosphatase [Deltaproteobacteria bacterium]
INLPFNYSSIKDEFVFSKRSSDTPSGKGSWIIIQGGNVIIEETSSGPVLPSGALPEWIKPNQEPLYIGVWRGNPLRALTISSSMNLEDSFSAEPFNAVEERLDIQSLTLAGLAKQVLHWERQSHHCSRCGSETENIESSWGKRCRSCSSEHFPHIHPCAIILVKRGNELLLTRKKEWPPGRYGLVAGFLDFGESLEECAAREVLEETGIEICNVRYVGSQNWPFPAQLMAGFVADYSGGEIKVDKHELEDARWFSNDALPVLPPDRSIARWIIDNFK